MHAAEVVCYTIRLHIDVLSQCRLCYLEIGYTN